MPSAKRRKRGSTISGRALLNACLSAEKDGVVAGEEVQRLLEKHYKHAYSKATIKGRIKLLNIELKAVGHPAFETRWPRASRTTEQQKLKALLAEPGIKKKLKARK